MIFKINRRCFHWSMLFIIVIVASVQADASQISNVTGEFSHNSKNVVIKGSGFGEKNPAAPYFYDNFESGADGVGIVGKTGTVGTQAWLEYLRHGSPKYSNSDAYGVGNFAAYKKSNGNNFQTAGIDGMLSNVAYLSYNFKWSATLTNWERAVYKLSRITSQGGLYSETPSVFPQYQIGYNWAYDGYNPGEGGPGNDSFKAPVKNKWHRAEIFMRLSEPAGATNGEVQTRYNNIENMNAKNVLTRTVSKSNKLLDSFILPFSIANNTSNTYSFWADNIYFDNTRARVEICNTPTWSSRTHCDIQIPVSWSSDGTSVGITFNQGAFTPGDTAYLYVVDSREVVSNDGKGYQILIGDTGGPTDLSPTLGFTSPTTGSNHTVIGKARQQTISVAGTASDDIGIESVTFSIDNGISGVADTRNGYEDWNFPITVNADETVVVTVTVTDLSGEQTSKAMVINYYSGEPLWEAEKQTGDASWVNSRVTYCVRLLIEGSSVDGGAAEALLGFKGRTTGSYSIRNVSIAQRDMTGKEGDVIDSTWTKVTFDGNAWGSDTTVTPGNEKVSDPVGIRMEAGTDYYVTFKINSPSVYLDPPAGYTELYFTDSDHTSDIDWGDNGHLVTQDFHALAKIYGNDVTDGVLSPPTGMTVE